MTKSSTAPSEKPGGSTLLIDLGPLGLFLLAYWLSNIFTATMVFMAATAAALIWSKIKLGKISPLLLFSGAMVLVLGGLTIFLHDKTFIKMKPTIYYSVVASILFFGTITKRPTLKAVMESAYPALKDHGWHLLTRNFAWFFVVMAIANEVVWRNSSDAFWLGYKLWGALPATLLFGACNVPMILRHSEEEADQPAV